MSTQGKMIKDLVRVKKESMMGKLANEFDPMEPWSAKSDAPIKNSKGLSEEESLDESNNKILFNYVKSLGYDPKFMPFAKLSTYSRSDAFKRYKQGHVFDRNKQDIKTEETLSELNKDTLYSYANKADKDIEKRHKELGAQIRANKPVDANKNSMKISNRDKGLDRAETRLNKEEADICQHCAVDPCICDDSHGFVKEARMSVAVRMQRAIERQRAKSDASLRRTPSSIPKKEEPKKEVTEDHSVNEAGTGHLMSFIKAKGLSPLAMDGNQKKAYSRSSEYKIFKARHQAEAIKETSGMGERADDWDDGILPAGRPAPLAKKKTVKEEADVKDTVCMDIPLLIRVLEFIREDVKTDVELHKVVERLIDMRHDVPLTMENYAAITGKLKESKDAGEYDYEGSMAKTLLQTICRNAEDLKNMLDDDENLPEWVQAKITKAEDYITTSLDYLKSTEELDEEVEQIEELKKTPDNMDSDTIGLAREDLRKWFSKTNPEGDWKRINSKGDAVGPCAREPGEPKPKCMSQKTRSELSKSERAAAVATKRKNDPVADRGGKGGKPVNVSNYGKGKLSEDEIDEACWDTHKQVGTKMKGGKEVPNCVPKNEEVEQIEEKNSPTNPALWSRAKSMARSKFDVYPSAYANGWASKWYKSKGGGWKSVKEDVVQEGIYGIEDSPTAATHSVKAMESKKISNAAKMVKAIHKKRVNETTYDWEKSEKGGDTDPEIKTTAKITLKGGKTMTGKPRDTVEIEPVLRTKINSPNGMKPNV